MDQRTFERIRSRIQHFNGEVENIRADPLLSDLGRRDQLQQAYDKAKKDVAKLRGDERQSVHDRVKQLERLLFGVRGDIVAFRDAQDRVASVKDASALATLMEHADSVGDGSLLRAAFAHAVRMARNPLGSDEWDALADEYASQHDQADMLEEYRRLSSSHGQTAALAEAIAISVPRPSELRDPRPASAELTPKQKRSLETREFTHRLMARGPG